MATRPLSSTVCSKCPRNIPSTVERRYHPSYCPTCHTTSSIQPHFAPPSGLVTNGPRAVKNAARGRASAGRRRRSVSRILFSRPDRGSSNHSSGPPVTRGIERPTRGNGRAIRARPKGQASLLRGLAPGGVYRSPPSRADLASSYLAVSPLLRTTGPGRTPFCGTFPRSLGAVVSGHPALRSPDFPPATPWRAVARPPPADTFSLSARLFAVGPPEENPLAARAKDHALVTLYLVEELRRYAHPAALTDAAANLHHRNATPPREDQLVSATKVVVDRLHDPAPLGEPEFLVVADAGDPHATVLRLRLGRRQPGLEVALLRSQGRHLSTGRGGRVVLGANGLFHGGGARFAFGHLERLRAQALVED